MPSKKTIFLKNKLFVSLARPCCRTSSGQAWTWGKKGWLLKKTEKEKKRAVLCLSGSLFIQWVSAGLARPATTAAATAATAAATFIDWIDLAAPPVRNVNFVMLEQRFFSAVVWRARVRVAIFFALFFVACAINNSTLTRKGETKKKTTAAVLRDEDGFLTSKRGHRLAWSIFLSSFFLRILFLFFVTPFIPLFSPSAPLLLQSK